MKLIIKKIIYWLAGFIERSGICILMYHSVSDNNESATVTMENFISQMEYLRKNHYLVISLSALAQKIINHEALPRHCACLSFDDGYEDNYLNVFPLLNKYGYPATFFVNTAYIDGAFTNKRGMTYKMLTAAQLKEMSASELVDIGSHAHNHLQLVYLDDERLVAEMQNSKKMLGDIIQRDVKNFAYPSGKYNEQVEQIARRYFDVILTADAGKVTENAHIWRLKRNIIDKNVGLTQFRSILKCGRL